jgi:uncharacterized protein
VGPAARRALLVNVADVRRRLGNRKSVEGVVPIEGIAVSDAYIPDGAEATIRVELESVPEGGVVATGHVSAPWEGTCRRCLGPAAGTVVADVREVFREHPLSDDEFRFDGERIDLAPVSRELLALELPLAPLCREDCAGLCPTCGSDLNVTDCGHDSTPTDPRWGPLADLKIDLSGLDRGDEPGGEVDPGVEGR